MEPLIFQDSPIKSVLPFDGDVEYFGVIMQPDVSGNFFQLLVQEIDWQHDEAIMYGKRIITKRKVGWYGDEPYNYTYSKVTRSALPWSPALLQLKTLVERVCGEHFNSCLLNLYHDGSEGMAWHSDAEKELEPNGAIASLSLGAERTFGFRHRVTKEEVRLPLPDGSLLVMKGTTQTHWMHSLLKTARVRAPRINLTFRSIRILPS